VPPGPAREWTGGSTVEGTIRLEGAVIHGMLALNGQLSEPEHRSLVGGSAMTVDGDVYLDGLRTDGGRINLRGATLASLVADGARLHNPGDYSISLKQATVKGSVQLIDDCPWPGWPGARNAARRAADPIVTKL
jgi:hypothetical protein